MGLQREQCAGVKEGTSAVAVAIRSEFLPKTHRNDDRIGPKVLPVMSSCI